VKNKILAIAQALFPGCGKDIESNIPYFELKKYKAGDLLVRDGETLDYVGFVFKGVLRKYFQNHSRDGQTLYFSFEGSIVAEMQTLLHNRPAIYCIQAVEDVELIVLRSHHIETLSQKFLFLQQLSLRQLEKAYTNELEKLVISTASTAESRYRQMLVQQPDIIMRVPGHYIASYLGIRPESLSRIRRNIAG
jgi:CRP-like cAMP-binding protein